MQHCRYSSRSPLPDWFKKTQRKRPMKWKTAQAPVANKDPLVRQRHEIDFPDPYHWMRDENWQDVIREPEKLAGPIRAHLEAENTYAQTMLEGLDGLKSRLIEEMKGRMVKDEASVPSPDGPWSYGSRYQEGAEHPLYVRYPREDGPEQVLLDCNARAKGLSFYQLGSLAHSPDHSRIIWCEDRKGSEYFEVFWRELASEQISSTGITASADDLVWLADSSGFLWVWRDENSRPKEVRLHLLAQADTSDRVLYREENDGFFLGISQTSDGKYALIQCNDHQTSEIWTFDLLQAGSEPACLWSRQTGIEVDVDHWQGTFSLLTNAGGAKDFQIVRVSGPKYDLASGTVLVPHRPGILVLAQQQFAEFHVRMERENAAPRIVIRSESDGEEHQINMEDAAFSLGLSGGYEFDTHSLRFAVSTPAKPREIYDYDMQDRSRTLRQRQQIPSGHDPDQYQVERLFAAAVDGEQIPITILRPAELKLDGSHPLLLYGYGAYGYSMPAGFVANHLSLLDRGVIYAIAHVRGGKEKGFGWYETGRREHKRNSFTDFIACAEHLIHAGYTSSGQIVASGASAGGLLMGAVVNMRPDLFAGIVARVPFVDVLNTMCDPSLPLTPPEWPEWGNPITSSKDCTYIASYCPISNVTTQSYPPIFVTAGLTDTRVTWWEPAKWIATLRDQAPEAGPFLLKTEMSAGHGGASGRYAGLDEIAEGQAFALKVLGRD
jgi:oligopeptidase B